MAINETTIAKIEGILDQVATLGGQREQTRIITGLEVVNATPTGLTNYIIIKDDRGEGTNIAALKVPGVTYTNGDLVSIIFIRGTEPVAFQQSTGSGTVISALVDRLVSPDTTINPIISTDNSGNLTGAGEGNVIFNEPGNSVDFRIESNNQANMFFVDGSADFIGVKTNSPQAVIDLSETYTDNTSHQAMRVDTTWSPTTTTGSQFPTATQFNVKYNTTHSPSGGFNTSFRLFGYVQNSGTINNRNIDVLFTNSGAGTVGDVKDIYIRTAINSGGGAITTYTGLFIDNQTVAGTNRGIHQNGTAVTNILAGLTVCGNITASVGQLTVDQVSTTGAIPVLYLRQRDVSEEFIEFRGSAAAATLTQSIVNESDVSTATRQGWLKVYVQDDGNQITDQAYFIPIYTLA